MTLAKAIARAWSDAAFKDKLVNDPHAALAEVGVDVPASSSINVVEDTNDKVYLVLPVMPDGDGDVSAEELEKIAGGLYVGSGPLAANL